MSRREHSFPRAPVRYCLKALPRYRHRPGHTPHPTAHPNGHSYQLADEPGRDKADVFRYGVDLYNSGYWWEAHEAWEEVWLATTPNTAERHALQGLIQTANCHLKLHMGRAKAVGVLLEDIERHFSAALLHHPALVVYGLDVAPFSRRVMAYGYTVLDQTPPAHDIDFFPLIALDARQAGG